MRHDHRQSDQLRPVEFLRRFTDAAAGSVLVRFGRTHVLCTASITDETPEWRAASGKGWLTAEYEMLPASTGKRRRRTRDKLDGRTQEIQRLIGRSLRATVDLDKLGPRTIHIDCDVLQADGGTRTAAITGAYIALADAIAHGVQAGFWSDDVRRGAVAAISVGVVNSEVLLDLDYREDVAAAVDCNLVMTDRREWIEVQATGEDASFDDATMMRFISMGRAGIERLLRMQRRALQED